MPRKIRQIRIEGNVAHIPLTQGYAAIIDAADVDLVGKHRWWVATSKRHKKAYAVGMIDADGISKPVLMHRFLLDPPHGVDVDHKNGNGLDNRRGNIRHATRSQNMHNKKMQHNNTSGYKGVHWHKTQQRWCANIKLGDKRKFLGGFDKIEDAARAYQDAAEKMHLDFARLR